MDEPGIMVSAIFSVLLSRLPGTPGLDSISDPFSWSWIPGLGRDPDAWPLGELATKPSARLTPSVPEKTTTKAPGKVPKSTKKWVTKTAKRPTTQPPVMPTTKHARAPGTQGAPELTSRTTTTLTSEAPPRLTSHTTATRTPRAPRERTSKTMATPTTQGPWEVTSEAPSKRMPQASMEPSAEIPAEGSPESSRDPAPSPTGSMAGGSGEWREWGGARLTPADALTWGLPPHAGLFRVRLADGPNRCAGRLEVWHAGRWGTVCDDNWDLRDGTVACWELGCGRIRPRVGKTHYGPGTGPIWLDDVGCKGSEASLSDCPARLWGQHNCDHEEDVGLTCTGTRDGGGRGPPHGDPESLEILEGELGPSGRASETAGGMGLNSSPASPKATQTRRIIPPGPGTPPRERTWPRGPPLQGRLDTLSPRPALGGQGPPPQQPGAFQAQVRAWPGGISLQGPPRKTLLNGLAWVSETRTGLYLAPETLKTVSLWAGLQHSPPDPGGGDPCVSPGSDQALQHLSP